MKKKNGIIVLVVVLSVAVIAGVGYKIADKFYAPLVQTKAVSYLCHKYDAEPDEFEMVDYNQAHIELKEYEIFFQKPVFVDFSFEYKYNDRNFVVNRNKNNFCDDYQMEDIQNWCTEWLKENVDERIVGFEFNTNDIRDYYLHTNKKYNSVIGKEDAKNFLSNYKQDDDCIWIYYYDVNGKGFYAENDELTKKAENILNLESRCSVTYTEKTLSREIFKYKYDNWDSWNTVK